MTDSFVFNILTDVKITAHILHQMFHLSPDIQPLIKYMQGLAANKIMYR
jgi:hypothetical protein